SAQNMVYADRAGNIGQVMAAMLPARARPMPPDLILDPADPASQWRTIATAAELPAAYNPKAGFLASANNKPTTAPFPIGYVFSQDDRMQRMYAFMAARTRLGLADSKALKRDVFVPSSAQLREHYLAAIARARADAKLDRPARRV